MRFSQHCGSKTLYDPFGNYYLQKVRKNDQRYYSGTVLSGGFRDSQTGSPRQTDGDSGIYCIPVFDGEFHSIRHSCPFPDRDDRPVEGTVSFHDSRNEADFVSDASDSAHQSVYGNGGETGLILGFHHHGGRCEKSSINGIPIIFSGDRIVDYDIDNHSEPSDGRSGEGAWVPAGHPGAGT